MGGRERAGDSIVGKKTKTEHAGAKNGGGYWGKREEAKRISKSRRREWDKELEREGLQGDVQQDKYKKSKRTRNYKASLEHRIQKLKQTIATTHWDWYRSSCKRKLKEAEEELKRLTNCKGFLCGGTSTTICKHGLCEYCGCKPCYGEE